MTLTLAIMTQGFGHVVLPAPGLGIAQWGLGQSWLLGVHNVPL